MKTETLETIERLAALSTNMAPGEDAAGSSHSVIHLKNILVPLDFSEMALKSLRYAIPFAKQFGAKLTLVHVVQAPVYTVDFSYYPALRLDQLEEIKTQLRDIQTRMIPADIPVEIVVQENLAFEGILEMAREIRADLIITTTHGHTGLKHLFLGSTAENIVRRAPCPVLVVRELEHDFV